VQKVRAFLLGVREFRRDLTTHFGEDLIEVYDRGREFAHKVTLRRWDDTYAAPQEAAWVIVEGGLVVDTSKGIDVFDLDVLHDDFPDHLTKSEVEDTLDRLHQSPAFVTSPALQQAARQCEKWLERY